MIDEKKLEDRLVALEAVKAWSPRVVSRLEMLLRAGTDEALYRINPIQFAAEKSIAEAEAIDLFLHACVVGLFDMDWQLVCPMCSDVVESFRTLRKLHTHFHCHLCQTDYDAALDDFITVTFTVSPAVRSIRFHQPDALSAWDYVFHYKLTPGGILPDGVPWREAAKGLVRVLTRIAPGATASLEIDAVEGALLGQDFDSDAQFFFPVASGAGVTEPHVPVALDKGKCVAAQVDIGPGKVVFDIRNAGELPVVFGILQLPSATAQRPGLRFGPSLSGKRVLMTQTFRDVFRSEVISATEGIAVLDVTLVFTDLKGSTALYERIGDLNAYIQVQRHFQHLLDVTIRHNGAVTKTIGDAVMAAFLTSADAVQAALEMREAVDQLNRDRPQRDFILKIGVHRGASIAVTLNERLDYFGQTVNIAARVQNLADGDEICITEDVHRAPDVADIIAPYPVTTSQAELKGVSKAVSVYRLARLAS
ncbi:adenylate/guanylate cyclase domain-containing protein [Bradyrhizobium jicamae]|uniref:adenylate/guanylate cyclase domain-containing protein n=1 Tax=Bradyrhizobium jicamae TaxID=280332 RepID=UPI001BA9DDF4|nr:adenylate/guanylate cyclase domain-containing protein [Bradyrhizobium jicamae]MBR0753021.1 adenylate/guanylate cyclase domain-containing protein [Bradyrhizobium jicamae]